MSAYLYVIPDGSASMSMREPDESEVRAISDGELDVYRWNGFNIEFASVDASESEPDPDEDLEVEFEPETTYILDWKPVKSR